MKNKNEKGFTLIEIMVVLVILSVLALFVVPDLMGRPDEARMVKVKNDIKAISASLDLYKLDNHVYPTTQQGLESLVKKPSGANLENWKPLLKEIPLDPWNKPYLYMYPGVHSEIDIFTQGADGVEGGEGINAMVGNWKATPNE